MRYLIALAAFGLFQPPTSADVISVDLIGGGATSASDATSTTFFSSANIAALTDSNQSTGFTHTSNRGDVLPNLTNGAEMIFEFNVSAFQSISQIDFTWTGQHQWDPTFTNPFPTVRLGPFPGAIVSTIDFGGTSDASIRSDTISFLDGGAGFTNLNNVLNGNIASIAVQTSFGISDDPDFLNLTTLEVSAVVTGELATVPEPSSIFLSGIGSLFLAWRSRRRTVG